jgi:4-amino-4-deoxy-L-arabinose transferase-like glycosyltransferase
MVVWGDWQLTGVPVDKPPLFLAVSGTSQKFIGQSEFALRLPNALASLLVIAVLYALAYHLSGSRQTALGAGLLCALSPFEIAFAVSAFTDTLLTLFLALALLCLLRGAYGCSGLAFGLGIAVKPAALWFSPLFLLLGLMFWLRPGWAFLRWIGRALLILALITAWDAASGLGSFWQLGGGNYAGGRLIRADEWAPRAEIWGDYLAQFPPWGGIWIIGGMGLGVYFWGERKRPDRAYLFCLALLNFCLAYLGLHWLTAFNTFDRYLLPLLPLILLLLGAGLEALRAKVKIPYPPLMILVLLMGLGPAWAAGQGETQIASDAGRHRGIDELAAVMNEQYRGEVFYEHWLGWELNYYLGPEPEVFLLYFPTPDALADHALAELPSIPVPRYLVGWAEEMPMWVWVLEGRGLRTEVVYQQGLYVIYRVSLE